MNQATASEQPRPDRDDSSWSGWPERSIRALLSVNVTGYSITQVCDELLATRLLGSIGAPRSTCLYVREELGNRCGPICSLRDGAIETQAFPPEARDAGSGLQVEDAPQLEDLPLEAGRGFVRLWLEHEGETVGCLQLSDLPDVYAEIPTGSWVFLASMIAAAVARHRHRLRVERSQLALASATRYLDRLLALVSDGLVVMDIDGQVLALNPKAQELLGAGAEAVGHPLGGWLTPACGSAVLALAQLAAHASTPVIRTVQWSRSRPSSNSVQQVEISAERVQADPELPAGLLLCIRDLEATAQQAWYQRAEEVRATQMTAVADSLGRPMAALRAYLWLLREEIPGTGRPAELWTSLDLQAEWLQSRLDTLSVLDQFRLRQSTWRDLPVDPQVLLDRALGRVRSRLELRGVSVDVAPSSVALRSRVDVEKYVLVLSHLLDELGHHLGGPGTIAAEFHLRTSPAPWVQLTLRGTADESDPAGNRRGEYQRLAEQAGVEETRSLYALPLARAVVHRYGGTLLWDRPANGVAIVTLTLPCDPGEPRG